MTEKKKREWKPTKERQAEILDTLQHALPYSLEIYGIKEMALDSNIPLKEAKWASEHVYFKACLNR